MKKFFAVISVVLALVLSFPIVASANMAAPIEADVGSGITFEKNDVIAVISEVLDITVHGSRADITATYRMKNTGGESVTTPAMFLSPNIENEEVKVTAADKDVPFSVESYAIAGHNGDITIKDWQYVVLEHDEAGYYERKVDSISFELAFAPEEEYDVVVSYKYGLGGYPDYDFDAKCGYIEYYLTPAAMWKDFKNLTVNLHLDEDMPVITSSNLDFEKVGKRSYRFVSDTLPTDNLKIVIDENWYQSIFSSLRSPYLLINLMIALPFILLLTAIIVIAVVIIVIVKKRHSRN